MSPGDVIFSFVDTAIPAIGTAQSYCWESPKPAEFGTTGQYWQGIGDVFTGVRRLNGKSTVVAISLSGKPARASVKLPDGTGDRWQTFDPISGAKAIVRAPDAGMRLELQPYQVLIAKEN